MDAVCDKENALKDTNVRGVAFGIQELLGLQLLNCSVV